MLKTSDLSTLHIGDWTIRYREPAGDGPHPVILLLHGWTGDEDSMWIFARKLPEDYLLIAPRGLYATPMGGFSWHPPKEERSWPAVDDFRPAIEALLGLMADWPVSIPADLSSLRIAGFSQGAALTYAFALLHAERISAIAALAGFMPEGAADVLNREQLLGLPVYISHGTQDQLVPVERARQAAEFFEAAGAEVSYCESEVGHKLSADCFRGMEVFFQE